MLRGNRKRTDGRATCDSGWPYKSPHRAVDATWLGLAARDRDSIIEAVKAGQGK